MVTKEQLEKKYAGMPTGSLLEILERGHDYTELAINAARAELAKRNVSEADKEAYREEKAEKLAGQKEHALEELQFGYKVLFFMLFIPLLLMTIRLNYRHGGYRLKLRQSYYYSLTGFIFLFGGAVISVTFSIGHEYAMIPAIGVTGFVLVYLLEAQLLTQPFVRKLNS